MKLSALHFRKFRQWSLCAAMLACLLQGCGDEQDTVKLLNVSYDPTRELFTQINPAFRIWWKDKTGQDVAVKQSHGGSGTQTRSVIDGLGADVVTLALAYDIDTIAERTGWIEKDWQSKLPHNSAPYQSTIVFLVRSGNPKQIMDWNDLAKPNVSVMTPNPKTSGGARWNYLAAWAYADKHFNGDETRIKPFIRTLFQNVPILDTGARGSITNFVKRDIGDVLIAWENEALLAVKQFGADKYEIIYPSVSIRAEPPVAVVTKHATRHKLLEAAQGYLRFLYTPEAQEIIAEQGFRPSNAAILAHYSTKFPAIPMVDIDGFGGWETVQQKHFSDGAIFDEIYAQ